MTLIVLVIMSYKRALLFALAMVAGYASAAHAGATTPAPPAEPAATNHAASVEQKYGIKVSGLFLSGGGNLVDFRYKVVDPAKAATLTKPELKPALLDETTGAKLLVPSTPKTGPLRQTVKQPVAGKVYFMLFANTRHHVKSGDKVTIVVGDAKIENLTVE
jgi:hypothetical protein